ncbi:MAG: hypothetical protein ABIR98_08355 [Usitatibacter sp.]
MGIKDWFGGEKAKKKEQLREKVKEAVQDGKLSNSDLMELKELQKALDVTPAADDNTELRREIYNEAVGAARNKGAISATGVHELSKIQKFLALRDDQIEKTKFQVTRLRTLTEVKAGNLPKVPGNSMALRDVTFEAGEIPHYVMQVDVLDQPMTRGQDGLALVAGVAYPEGEAAGHGLPDEGAKDMGESTLIVSNRRLILKTRGRLAAIKLGPEAKIYLYSDGLRLERTVGNTLLRFRSRSDETAEIVGALLSALMRA